MVARAFGTPLNPKVPKEPTAYKGKVPRGEEPCGPHTGFDCSKEYANTYCRDEHNSEFERKTWSPDPTKGSHWERVDGNGNGFIRGPDGSELRFVNGTSNFHGKNGGIETLNSNKDSATYGGSRTNIGTDGQAGGKHLGGRYGGGSSNHTAGNRDILTAGVETTASMTASGKTSSHLGKYTINAEGGIGFGVNKGSGMKIFQRMEPDGTFHLQVTPAGQEGGNMTMKVSPDGTIMVTSKTSMTVKTDQAVTIETPSTTMKTNLTLKGNFTHQGNYSQSGRHRDSWNTPSRVRNIMASLKYTTETTGNGNIILVEDPGANLQTGDTFSMEISSANDLSDEWEVSNGTYILNGEISRDSVEVSGSNNEYVDFSEGIKYITIALSTEQSIRNSSNVAITNSAIAVSTANVIDVNTNTVNANTANIVTINASVVNAATGNVSNISATTIDTDSIVLGNSTINAVAAANGYTVLPNAIIFQWGWVEANSSVGNITFPVAFPATVFSYSVISNTMDPTYSTVIIASNTTTMNARTSNATATNCHWVAIGN